MKTIAIGEKEIGSGKPCLIIAEAGVNHNGSLETAKKMVDAAREAGVDAVKFQSFKSEDLVTKGDGMAEYQQQNAGKRETQQKMLKRNLPFLAEVAGKGKPVILSTGMSTMDEAKEARDAIYNRGNRQVVMLHCTSSYPCALEDVNLRAMLSMQEELGCLVGYSDHSQGKNVPIMACALGAAVVEKHFTLDKGIEGPDHKASSDPKELAEMVAGIRRLEAGLGGKALKPEELDSAIENMEEAERALGSAEKKPTKAEENILRHARKSIVAAKDIGKGSEIASGMICIKRPGTGIAPKEFEKVVGKKAKRELKEDSLISWSDLE